MDANQGDRTRHSLLEVDGLFAPEQYNAATTASSAAYTADATAGLYPSPSYASNALPYFSMPGQDGSTTSGGMPGQTGVSAADQQQSYQAYGTPSSQDMSAQYSQNSATSNMNVPKLEAPNMPFEDFSSFHSVPDTHPSLINSPFIPSSPHTLTHSINPADLSRQPSPNSSASPRPPSLRYSAADPLSPVSSPAPFYTPQHSRHTSLDPSTAAAPPPTTTSTLLPAAPHPADWHGLLSEPHFRNHRAHTRAPSEVSDVSSVPHSPFPQHEAFEYDAARSPLLGASEGGWGETLGMEAFTLSDYRSPYNLSPSLVPQRPGGDGGGDLGAGFFMLDGGGGGGQAQGQQSFEQFLNGPGYLDGGSGMAAHLSADMGQAAQMTPPSINVEFAPPARQASFGPKFDVNGDTLGPPMARRGRSKSDPFGNTATRSASESALPSNTLTAPLTAHSAGSLSPTRAGNLSTPTSRDASPVSRSRRQSTSSIENRNYILDLADPQRPGGSTPDSKRVQKHPASFQCSLCPKRFTRAYNLRSHLRTHTDERPFVCTVCGKAFARQHDRKRHEGLHSGEKKFVCSGALKGGTKWGCGRRFARADALGRHFRSEAGRICIKPLLDEEAAERGGEAAQAADAAAAGGSGAAQGGFANDGYQPLSQPMMHTPLDLSRPSSGFMLPQALIAQYPALRALNWDRMPGDDGGGGAHTPYDASSAGELSFTEDDGYLSSSSQVPQTGGYGPSPVPAAAGGGGVGQQGLGVPRPGSAASALSADAAWQKMDVAWGGGGYGYGQ